MAMTPTVADDGSGPVFVWNPMSPMLLVITMALLILLRGPARTNAARA
jgi:hypothetical protein